MFLLIGFGQYFLISVLSLGHFLGFISLSRTPARRIFFFVFFMV